MIKFEISCTNLPEAPLSQHGQKVKVGEFDLV